MNGDSLTDWGLGIGDFYAPGKMDTRRSQGTFMNLLVQNTAEVLDKRSKRTGVIPQRYDLNCAVEDAIPIG